MRQVAKKGLLTVVATGGMLAMTGGLAYADANAEGAALGSPGVLSGNLVQAPVHIPVNVCGNTVNVLGALNSASGNSCGNGSGGDGSGGGSSAGGVAKDSGGIGSGNLVQAPVDAPVNVCGNSVSIPGADNTAGDNTCANDSGSGHPGSPGHPHHPPKPHQPPHAQHPCKPRPAKPGAPARPTTQTKGAKPVTKVPATASGSELAHTGSDNLGLTLVTSAGLLLGGAVLFRRSRAARN